MSHRLPGAGTNWDESWVSSSALNFGSISWIEKLRQDSFGQVV